MQKLIPSKKGSFTKKRAILQAAEEKVSLIAQDGKPMPSPEQRTASNASTRIGMNTNIHNMINRFNDNLPWTFSRLMRYLSLTAVSAMVTFVVLHKESKVIHWDEYHYLLEPEADRQHRCYAPDAGSDERCTCPDPAKPLSRSEKRWKKHHDDMVKDAKMAPEHLDLVMLGDSIIERWNGTDDMGEVVIPGMRRPFENRFTTRGGGMFEGLALGSAGDTGPNLLWHLENGLLSNLNPKIWLILVGSNDLYDSKCTDRFVFANVLNVLKTIFEHKPDAQFIVHGILPRKDNPASKSQFLGTYWKRAQAINLQLRKFCEHSTNIHYMQSGPLFMEETSVRGRKQMSKALIDDGIHPTQQGLERWGDYILKEIMKILKEAEEHKNNKKDVQEST